MSHNGFSYAVGYQITQEDVDYKFDNRFQIGLAVAKGKTLVEEIA